MVAEQVGDDRPIAAPGKRDCGENFGNPKVRRQRLGERRLPGAPGKYKSSINVEQADVHGKVECRGTRVECRGRRLSEFARNTNRRNGRTSSIRDHAELAKGPGFW